MAEQSIDSGNRKRMGLAELHRRLIAGEKVICSKCGIGYYIPYNAPANEAHYFNCSNPECDNHYHWDPVIDVE